MHDLAHSPLLAPTLDKLDDLGKTRDELAGRGSWLIVLVMAQWIIVRERRLHEVFTLCESTVATVRVAVRPFTTRTLLTKQTVQRLAETIWE